jgi:hypothetical protein
LCSQHGKRPLVRSNLLLVEQEDAALIDQNEEVRLRILAKSCLDSLRVAAAGCIHRSR